VPKVQCLRDDPGDTGITKRAGADSPVKVLFNFSRTVVGEEDLVLRQRIHSRALGCPQYPMALDNLFQYMQGKRICEMECDEIKAFFLLPVWKASTIPNVHFTEAGLNSPLHGGWG
jgi:hypothetical protein